MNTTAFATQWGATANPDGSATFRLWAPTQPEVSLLAGEIGSVLPMTAAGDGWHQLRTNVVQPGDAYGFRLADGRVVPDPASRWQVGDVHGLSRLVDPQTYQWTTLNWRGRRWEDAVIYELHVGTFTEAGTFDGVGQRLDHLAELGITAIEVMPIAQFGGSRG